MPKLWVLVLWIGHPGQASRMGEISSMTDMDPLVAVSIKIRASQYVEVKNAKMNLSEFVREKLDESFP